MLVTLSLWQSNHSACFVLIHCIVLRGAICPSVQLHMVHLNNNDMI